MGFGYYPGCALAGSSKEYDISVRKVNAALGGEMKEIEDWSCCGASAAHMTHHKLTVALNARNLALAEEQGFGDMLAPCPLCSRALIAAHKELQDNKNLREEIFNTIGKRYSGKVTVLNYLQVVEKYYAETLISKIARKFEGLTAACYYGCLLVRPPKVVEFDDAENPQSMERLVSKFGLKTVEWNYKVECCGAGMAVSRPDIVTKLSRDIIDDAKNAGADFIIAACPMCQANLDMRQANIAKVFGVNYEVPIVYLSELIGLALGMKPAELGLNKHFIEAAAVFEKIPA